MSPSSSSVDLRQQQLVGERERPGVELATADHEHRAARPSSSASASSSEPARSAPSACQAGVARDHDVPPAGKRTEAVRERVPGTSSHDDGMPHRELPESRRVLRDPPGETARAPDHAAARDGCDERDLHTATGARIAGWCWYPTTSKSSNAYSKIEAGRRRSWSDGYGNGVALELRLDLLAVVVVDVAVAARPDQVADLEVALLREHVREKRVARDVERDAEEHVRASLVDLAAQPLPSAT